MRKIKEKRKTFRKESLSPMIKRACINCSQLKRKVRFDNFKRNL